MPELRTSISRLEACYQRGLKLSSCDGNHDYAHEMLLECVLNAPANVAYAEAMLKNLREKLAGQRKPGKARFFSRLPRVLTKAARCNEWNSVFRQGVVLLKENPWNIAVLRTIAHACEELHYNEAELVYLKQALDSNPKDIKVNRHCACSLGRMGQFDQAIACWHRIETLRGKDAESARMISQLAEEKLKHRSGISPTPAAPVPVNTVGVNQLQATALAVGPTLTPRQLLECAVGGNPQDEYSHLRLADELIASAAYEEAERRLRQALIACDNSQPLLEKLGQVRALLAQQRQAQATATLHASQQHAENESRMPWLELLLGAAMFALVLQFFPALGTTLRQALDFRNWGRGTWFVANLLVLLLLCGLRFVPELLRLFRRKRVRMLGLNNAPDA